MKSFHYLATVIALTLIASHQVIAAPMSENQARSDGQSNIYPEAFPLPYNVAVSNIGSVGNQIGVVSGNVPPNAVVISSSSGNSNPNGVNVVSLSNSPTGGNLAESIIGSVGNQIGEAFGNISPSAVIIHEP